MATAAAGAANTKGPSMTQQQVIANLQAVKRTGVNLANVNQALTALIDAVVYLVEKTPGQVPEAKGSALFREAGK